MKKILIIAILIIAVFFKANGQWCQKNYGVPDVELMSDSQLSEALWTTNRNLIVSGGVTAFGGLMAVLINSYHPGMSDDPGFIEELIGDEGMDKIGIGIGLGLAAGGTVGCIVYGVRRGSIKSVINNRNPYSGTIDISPVVISNRITHSTTPALKVIITF